MKKETEVLENDIVKMIDNLLDDGEAKPKGNFQFCLNGEPLGTAVKKQPRKSNSNKLNHQNYQMDMISQGINVSPMSSTGKLIQMPIGSYAEEGEYDRSSTNFSNTNRNYTSQSRVSTESLIDLEWEKRLSGKSLLTINTPIMSTRSLQFLVGNNPPVSFCPIEYLQSIVFPKQQLDYEDLNKLTGSFTAVLKTQNGSRVMQNCLHKTNSDIIWSIYEEIEGSFGELCVHLYGNYFLQKLYDHLDHTKRLYFLNKIKGNIIDIAKNHEGTFFLQTIIKSFISKEEMKILIEAMEENYVDVIKNENATYVIEKVIENFDEETMQKLIEVIMENFIHLACHGNGLCVIKKLIGQFRTGPLHSRIQTILSENFSVLIQHQSGNYSVQEAIDKWKLENITPIIKLFYGQFQPLSMQKYSSNAVEKCFIKGGDQVLNQFTDEVCNKTKMLELMKNQYGNYVVRKALYLSSGPTKSKLLHHVKKNLEKLTDNKLITKWKGIIGQFSNASLKVQSASSLNYNDSFNNSYNSHNSTSSNNTSFISNHSPSTYSRGITTAISLSPVAQPKPHNSPMNVQPNRNGNMYANNIKYANNWVKTNNPTGYNNYNMNYNTNPIQMNEGFPLKNTLNLFPQPQPQLSPRLSPIMPNMPINHKNFLSFNNYSPSITNDKNQLNITPMNNLNYVNLNNNYQNNFQQNNQQSNIIQGNNGQYMTNNGMQPDISSLNEHFNYMNFGSKSFRK